MDFVSRALHCDLIAFRVKELFEREPNAGRNRSMRKSAACDFPNTSWHPDLPIIMIFREEEMFDKKYEDLQLPTSRLVRRRRHLGRVYEQVLNTFLLLCQSSSGKGSKPQSRKISAKRVPHIPLVTKKVAKKTDFFGPISNRFFLVGCPSPS